MVADWLTPPDAVGLATFLVGWCAGWVGFVRARTMPRRSATAHARASVSVIVPCRNEATNLAELLPGLRSVLTPDDEIIVVDDESVDDTVDIARSHGATTVRAGALPSGWAGKPHACWQGSKVAIHDVFVFVDADVRVGNGAIDDLVAMLDECRDGVVSAMPFHRTVGPVEKLSMLFNVVSAMVASTGSRSHRRVAYGPFLAVRREAYFGVDGHSNERVRDAVVEDLALARAMPMAVARVAARGHVEYRMYPLGIRQLLEGWTKNTAIGAAQVPRSSSVLIIAWIIALCGGPFTSVWCYVLSVGQLAVMARRFGNFGPFSVLTYPIHAIVFVAVALRSLLRSAVLGRVDWRGRSVATR